MVEVYDKCVCLWNFSYINVLLPKCPQHALRMSSTRTFETYEYVRGQC
jgi:hypothetical protein